MLNFDFKYFFVLLFIPFMGCSGPYSGVPEKYHAALDGALEMAGNNRSAIEGALYAVPDSQKEGMAFLVAHMPTHDLQSLSTAFLVDNVRYAYKAREAFSWAAAVPDSIFFNEVLPYASLNERRDSWREVFFQRFSKYVKDASGLEEAIDSVNKNIRDELKVDYNTAREKPDQSPYESMEQGMASCSGLSILLTDAFRSVGIPSRIAGTANWHDNRGNHNWCEVWVDGEWYFTEYYPSGLNQSWFLADAGKADANDPEHAIYASSYKPERDHFPLVWDRTIEWVPARNVTPRYVALYEKQRAGKIASGELVEVRVSMLRNKNTGEGDHRIAANVDVFKGEEQVAGGRTADATRDLNDWLTFYLPKNSTYTFKYSGADGATKTARAKVAEKPVKVQLYME